MITFIGADRIPVRDMHKGETVERRIGVYIFDKTFPTLDCANLCPHPLYIPLPQAMLNKYVTDKRGCPPCRLACPARAITSNNFSTEQIMAEIEGVLV